MFSLLAATYLSDGIAIALTMGSSIAFVIHSVDRSFDPRLGLGARGFGVSIHLHGSLSHGISIALLIQSLDRYSLPRSHSGAFRGWCAGDL